MLGRLKSFVTTPTPSSEKNDPFSSLHSSLKSALPAPPPLPLPKASQLADLKAEIPTSCSSCDSCEDEEGEGAQGDHDFPELPRKFEVDLTSEMLGSVKPMHRLAVISTSKMDWMHDIAEETNSLAFHLSLVHQRKNIRPSPPTTSTHKPVDIPGVYDTQETSKLTVLASSVEVDSDEGRTTALLFPDFKFISSIPISKAGANAFYNQSLDPAVGPLGVPALSPEEKLQSWVLPYKAVILLCSHKTRDKKCGIAAPLLESVLTSTLTLHNHTVDNTGSSLHHLHSSEEISKLSSEEEIQKLLRNVSGTGAGGAGESSEVGIFKISHLGGHRYSGVMIICFPSGAILYYGRVRPRDCVAIVEKTVLKGEVIPEHLRGGGNLRREKGKSLLDW
ncbi:Sucrase/ferredoxin-like-domain-containing protein [Mrakia frigida]|uniref:sucrase/ferredoxin-like domain-containing protein n=1 Tax=Mrakia frigida TaxID=29902 RepID=UPI003FCC0894